MKHDPLAVGGQRRKPGPDRRVAGDAGQVDVQTLVVIGWRYRQRFKESVYLMEAGKAVFRPLKTGLMGDLTVEVVEGLRGGETIITGPFKALRELKDQDKVKLDTRKTGS